MNTVNLIGRLARDTELRYTQSQHAVCRFTVAVDRAFKVDGQPTADFITCVAWNKTGEAINKYFEKGNRIGITGRLQVNSWQDTDGKNRYVTEVIVDSFDFCESKNKTQTTTNDHVEYFNLDSNNDDVPF